MRAAYRTCTILKADLNATRKPLLFQDSLHLAIGRLQLLVHRV
jgi:hypothetical protein